MSTDGFPAGVRFNSIKEWQRALFGYPLHPEQGYYLGFEPYNGDHKSSEADLEERNELNATEDENGHPSDDPTTNGRE